MNRNDLAAIIIGIFGVYLVGSIVKRALFPPDPAYIARRQELALAHAARMHLIEEIGLSVLFVLVAIILIVIAIAAYKRTRTVTVKPDEGGQFPLIEVRTSKGRLWLDPNKMLSGAVLVGEQGFRDILPEHPAHLAMQSSVTRRAQAVQAIRAGSHGNSFLFPADEDVIDGEAEAPPVTVLEKVSGEDIARQLEAGN